MNAGKLDRKIVIERLTIGAANAFNETSDTWGEFITRQASRQDVSDSEKVNAGQVNATRMSRFVIRSGVEALTITPMDRVNYDSKLWDIKGIKETTKGRGRFLEITAIAQAD